MNGDGLDDILIGVANRNSWAGETYLVYGHDVEAPLSGPFDLANADVTIIGIDSSDRSGWSVSSAGDINGDGLDDLLIGADLADPNGDLSAGETYLVYGRADTAGIPGDFDSDGDVDGADFLMWQRGEISNPPNQSDLDDWQEHFGTVASSVALL